MVTIKDIAKQLGISVSTVSRALNNHSDIKKETKLKVLETVKKLNYRPNSIARSLIHQRTFTVGLMIPDITDPFFSTIAVGAQELLSEQGYQVIIGNTLRDKDKEKHFIDSAIERKMDGLIVTPDHLDEELIELLANLSIPVVFLRRKPPKKLKLPYVDVNHYKGACEAVEHIISLGHRKIGYLGMPLESQIAIDRFQGYKDTLQKYDIPYIKDFIKLTGGRTIQSGRETMDQFIPKLPQMTALFAYNDLLAIGALESLAHHHIRVPEEISIMGFDDLEISSLYWIQLSTMSQPRNQMGRYAAETILKMMNPSVTNEIPEYIILDSTLVQRNTCTHVV
ncbi:LacI family DNA-binding transcriptional regulator [Chengkuizengella axinellae]|uniref:LacI family DNA-binding transcriptional regulator n=1 Tax=Chengkuizengella axinellae TaxID=3064388 RepID=A0ABT9IZ28_9BACL|nr:LacI family DNA-binding transcriptional regulator [Chengkuizengella sp. 2205SS18-9]MDP5274049.1 LacI family DNA-binding transcriptional regulator [Chengkuizengella sp. 2205SS18-9]